MNSIFKCIALIILCSAPAFLACDRNEKQIFIPVASGTPSSEGLAVVTTAVITGDLAFTKKIAGTSATGGGNVTSQGDSAVSERGLCWNTTGNPTISDSHVADGSGAGAFTDASMTGLTVDTRYFVRAYAVNSKGTSYGNETAFNSGKTFGTDHAGGYVYYNNGNCGGLVSSKTDQSAGMVWITGGSTQTTLNGNTSAAIGAGQINSTKICAQTGHTGSAAKVCLDFSDGAYSDWFLPSYDDLDLMYLNLRSIGIGNYNGYGYWSSSEYNADNARVKFFSSGSDAYNLKSLDSLIRVRAVRAFQ